MSKPESPRVIIQGIHDQKEFPYRKISYEIQEISLEGRKLSEVVDAYLITHIVQEKHIDRLHLILVKEDYGWPHSSFYF